MSSSASFARGWLAGAPFLFLVACFSGGFYSEPLNAPVRQMASKDPANVPILTQPPRGRFVEVALLHAEGGLNLNDACRPPPNCNPAKWGCWPQPKSCTRLEALRFQGARMGCDAVVVVGEFQTSWREPFAKEDSHAMNTTGTCIQYTDPSDGEPSASR